MSNKPLIIYHAPCMDGFGAAYAAWRTDRELEFLPAKHSDTLPDVTGREVFFLDICFKRDVMSRVASQAQRVVILDHHVSAQRDLEGLEAELPAGSEIRFDMKRSGAALAWEFFHAHPVPKLIQHIEDRDLWRFKLRYTREIHAALSSYPYDFAAWDALRRDCDQGRTYYILVDEGKAILRKQKQDVAALLATCQRELLIGGYLVPAASVPFTLISEAADSMCQGLPTFAAGYWDTPEGRVFGLRSDKDGMDVSRIAEQFAGGGGHKHAAGFTVPYWQLARDGSPMLLTSPNVVLAGAQ